MKRSKPITNLLHADSDEPATKTALALRELRSAIRSGRIHQGQQLTIGELSEQLGMSHTPVREAVRTLQAEGLLQQTPHHIVTVITLSEKDVHDMYEVRQLIEPMATRLAMPHLAEGHFATLQRLNEAIHDADRRHDIDQRYALNHDWHFTLYACAQNRVLLSTITSLWQRFWWHTSWSMPNQADSSFAQHAAILDALRARDASLAEQLMREHITGGQQRVLEHLRQQFADAR